MAIDYQDDYRYAQNRLVNTYVVYKDLIVRVDNISRTGECTCVDVVSRREMYIPLCELNLSPIRLGYVNVKLGTIYLLRIPKRRPKQGLYNGVLNYGNNFRWNQSMVDSILKDIYPSLDYCIEAICNEEVDSIAFSKIFALSFIDKDKLIKEIPLFYKEREVGLFNIKSNIFHLNPKYGFLEETLSVYV